MYGQVCKKSRIDKVNKVKKSQNLFSDITFQISEQEAEATGTFKSKFLSNEEVFENIEISSKASNNLVENVDIHSLRALGSDDQAIQ